MAFHKERKRAVARVMRMRSSGHAVLAFNTPRAASDRTPAVWRDQTRFLRFPLKSGQNGDRRAEARRVDARPE